MISDQLIQADLISKLKSIPTGTSYLGDNQSGIRELQWQGDQFLYPNIRLDIEDNRYEFDEQEKCGLFHIEFSVYVFSEKPSSKECSTIKGLYESYLTGLGWTGQYGKYNRLRLLDNVPAVREDERTWRSQLRYGTRVQMLP